MAFERLPGAGPRQPVRSEDAHGVLPPLGGEVGAGGGWTRLLANPVPGAGFWVRQLRISKPWAAPTAPGATSAAVYLTIDNRSDETDRLMAVRTPVAERVTFAEEERGSGGVTQMLAYIELRPRRETPLRPGRVHLRLEGLKQPLVKGRPFPMTLVFGSTNTVEVRVDVDDR
jgi:copper(I)-binding protein